MKIKLAVITLFSTILFGFNQFKNNLIATPLEAVLVVGNTEESTATAIKDMDKLALIFQNNGIKVTKFYNSNTNWKAIKMAAKTDYADNYGGGLDLFLTHFLEGKTVEECYEATTKETLVCHEIIKPFAFDHKKQIAISSDQPRGVTTQYIFNNGKTTYKKILSFKNYDIAFVGNPSFSIEELTGLK
jgi:hypothetical protein